jgi:hypothetical protein
MKDYRCPRRAVKGTALPFGFLIGLALMLVFAASHTAYAQTFAFGTATLTHPTPIQIYLHKILEHLEIEFAWPTQQIAAAGRY